jgi:hypothetical protein
MREVLRQTDNKTRIIKDTSVCYLGHWRTCQPNETELFISELVSVTE